MKLTAIKVPKDHMSSEKVKRAVKNGLRGIAKDIKIDFDVTTQTWKHRPQFETQEGEGYIEVFTIDKIYTIVTRGARPHMIYPRRAKRLRFMSKFRPKSRPGAIRSNKGFVGGNPVYAMRVRHPGHKARDFDVAIAKKWQKESPDIMQRAIDAELETE